MARALQEVGHQLLRSAVAGAGGLILVGRDEVLHAAITALPTPQVTDAVQYVPCLQVI